ncbi:MAG: hypothetical protein JWO77_838 [Ilumatobacteraceae bacterium]|nr:hypothetical protein [Ilumatobacteraceae bacterium]
MAKQQVAFLRAVNVGRRRVAMADLKADLEGLGFDDVWTYINSGYAVFRSPLGRARLEPQIEGCLAASLGFEVETFVRTAAQVEAAVALRPFGDLPDGVTHLVAFLRAAPSASAARTIEGLSGEVDQLVVEGADVHWRIEGASLDTALKPKNWKAAGAGLTTTRNVTMLTKLAAKLG